MNIIFLHNIKRSQKGFVLIYTLFISTIMLLLTTSISVALVKQLYFSRISRLSQAAYYAADAALMCATSIDDTYVNGVGEGIFPSHAALLNEMQITFDYVNGDRLSRGLPIIENLTDIKCAGSDIFSEGPAYTDFSIEDGFIYQSEVGRKTTFNMRMDIGDGTFRCAKVTINKTESYRQIISQGYPNCDRSGGVIERAIVNTTVN